MNAFRSDLYRLLAEALAEPPEWLAWPGREWPLFEAALGAARESQAARQAVEALLAIGAEPLDTRRARYAELFWGQGSLSTSLYESGMLSGKILSEGTFEVERWYRAAGLAVAGAELADHASNELAFLAFLSELGDPDAPDDSPACTGEGEEEGSEKAAAALSIEKSFLQQHAARWLPLLGKRMAASGDPVYAPVGQLLAGWLVETCQVLQVPGFEAAPRRLKPAAFVPGMVEDPHSLAPSPEGRRGEGGLCTLCSFCVQSCRSGALSIRENEEVTALVLAVGLCSGCGKCVRACEQKALQMQPAGAQDAEAGAKILKQSERAVCKACGARMVSLAELAFVSERLGSPGWLDYCPECRF